VNWGSAPDWLAAIGSIAAVSISLLVAVRERNARKRAEEQLSSELIRRFRSDAEAFLAWIEVVPSYSEANPAIMLHMQNSGSRPIFDITVTPVRIVTGTSGQRIVASVVGPNAELKEDVTDTYEMLVGLNGLPERWLSDPQIIIGARAIFRDANGYGWERTVAGTLFEVPVANVEALNWRDELRDHFTHVPWARPDGWRPTHPDLPELRKYGRIKWISPPVAKEEIDNSSVNDDHSIS
jgi:hypothetical protein